MSSVVWFSTYRDPLSRVFAEVERALHCFPKPVGERGVAYLQQFDPAREHSTKNYICYLLPYWLGPWSEIESAHCEQLSKANVWMMLYYFLLDDLMDSEQAAWREMLALANLCQAEMLSIYQSLFPEYSCFWTYYKKFLAEWAMFTANEAHANMGGELVSKAAWKASPLKASVVAVCELSGRNAEVEKLLLMVETVLSTLQFSDDLADWCEDLETGSHNCLLEMVAVDAALSRAQLKEEDVRQYLYDRGGLSAYANLVRQNEVLLNEVLLEAEGLELVDIQAFHHAIVEDLTAAAAQAEADKALLAQGGFAYWLSKG